ncbi:MAG: toxin-antitoxin system HicB family antitoxin [Rhodospirillaceae bacterium]|nr:toxin-antitoxin system HicB family antitoxin [Rhodospirillaceae bacterium]
MKRIIDGRAFNTDTATRIARDDRGHGKDGHFAILYQARDGGFFLAGAGGEESEWARRDGDRPQYSWVMRWDDGAQAYRVGLDDSDVADIRPLGGDEARAWLVETQQHFVFDHLFGEAADNEDGQTATYCLRLPTTLKARATDAAEKAGVSLNAWLTRTIEQRLVA